MTSTNARYNVKVHGKSHVVHIDPRVMAEFRKMAEAADMYYGELAERARRDHNGTLSEAITAFVQKNTDTPLFKHVTRDAWMTAAVDALRPVFAERGFELPAKIRAGIGFMHTGWKSKHLGECAHPKHSTDGYSEIFINVMNDDAEPLRIFNILTHELCHARDHADGKDGHGKSFRLIGEALDLEGKPKSMMGEAAWASWAAPLCEELGPIPHSAMQAVLKEKKQQTTRMIKCQCPDCNAIWRISRKPLEEMADHGIRAIRCLNPFCFGEQEIRELLGSGEESEDEAEAPAKPKHHEAPNKKGGRKNPGKATTKTKRAADHESEEKAQSKYDKHDYPERRGR